MSDGEKSAAVKHTIGVITRRAMVGVMLAVPFYRSGTSGGPGRSAGR